MFADNVRTLRKSLKLTQPEMGKMLCVSRSTISNWEYGLVEPNDMVIRHFHNTFNVREEWLRTGEGPMYEETPKEYVESLIEKHNLGPGGQMLMRALLRFYEELGEDATLKVIAEILPEIQQAVAEGEADITDRILARQMSADAEETSQGTNAM